MTTPEDNKEIARRIVHEGWNEQNLDVIDELYSAEYVGHWFLPGGDDADRESLKGFMRDVFRGFPDYEMEIEFVHADDDYVTVGFTGMGTHQGEFMGIPPGEVSGDGTPTPGHITSRIEDGQIVEGWATWDALGLLQGLGVVPENPAEAALAADD